MIEDKLDIRIICFGFCRPNKMASLLKSLVKNKEAINLDLVAFIDGARNSNDVNKHKLIDLLSKEYQQVKRSL